MKQFTTYQNGYYLQSNAVNYTQRYKNEAVSEALGVRVNARTAVGLYTKIQKMKAIHNYLVNTNTQPVEP